jgi:hypothetical protein
MPDPAERELTMTIGVPVPAGASEARRATATSRVVRSAHGTMTMTSREW